MEVKMKRFIFIIFLGLLFCGSVFSQELSNCVWQLQNPAVSVNSEMINFKNGRFNYDTMNLSTKEKNNMTGSYQILGNQITLSFDGSKSFVFTVSWLTPNKMALSMNGNNLFYAKAGTSDDQFMKNLIFSTNPGGNTVPNTYNTPKSAAAQPCWPCSGTGHCNVCNGKGTIGKNKCPDCFGSGVCKHCSGTGVFQPN